MPRGSWSPQRERQYKHILQACLRQSRKNEECPCTATPRCKRIAAATTNKARRAAGEARR